MPRPIYSRYPMDSNECGSQGINPLRYRELNLDCPGNSLAIVVNELSWLLYI
jgi:hypothetical protein